MTTPITPDPHGRDESRWSVYRMVDDIDVQYHITAEGDVWWTCVQAQSDGTVLRTAPSLRKPINDDEVRWRIECEMPKPCPPL